MNSRLSYRYFNLNVGNKSHKYITYLLQSMCIKEKDEMWIFFAVLIFGGSESTPLYTCNDEIFNIIGVSATK